MGLLRLFLRWSIAQINILEAVIIDDTQYEISTRQLKYKN